MQMAADHSHERTCCRLREKVPHYIPGPAVVVPEAFELIGQASFWTDPNSGACFLTGELCDALHNMLSLFVKGLVHGEHFKG